MLINYYCSYIWIIIGAIICWLLLQDMAVTPTMSDVFTGFPGANRPPHAGWARTPTPPRIPQPLAFLFHFQLFHSPSRWALCSLSLCMCSLSLLPHRVLGTPPLCDGLPHRVQSFQQFQNRVPLSPGPWEYYALFGLHLPTSQLGNYPQVENWRKWGLTSWFPLFPSVTARKQAAYLFSPVM